MMTVKNAHPDPQAPKARRGRPAKKATQENKDLQVSKDLSEKKVIKENKEIPVLKENKDHQVPKENPVNAHVPATTFLLVLITSLAAMTIILAFVPMALLP
jgi:hypothetical protein